jgi:hypothetical protein
VWATEPCVESKPDRALTQLRLDADVGEGIKPHLRATRPVALLARRCATVSNAVARHFQNGAVEEANYSNLQYLVTQHPKTHRNQAPTGRLAFRYRISCDYRISMGVARKQQR